MASACAWEASSLTAGRDERPALGESSRGAGRRDLRRLVEVEHGSLGLIALVRLVRRGAGRAADNGRAAAATDDALVFTFGPLQQSGVLRAKSGA